MADARERFTDPNQLDLFLTAPEVAGLVRCHPKTVYAKYRRWGIRPHRIGRGIRFRREDVEAWIERQKDDPCPPAGRFTSPVSLSELRGVVSQHSDNRRLGQKQKGGSYA